MTVWQVLLRFKCIWRNQNDFDSTPGVGSPSVEMDWNTWSNILWWNFKFPKRWTQQVLRAAKRTVSLLLACCVRPMQPSFIATISSNNVDTYGREAYVISPLLSGHISRFNLRFLITFFMFLPNTDAAPICLPSVGAIVKKSRWRKRTHTRARAFKHAQKHAHLRSIPVAPMTSLDPIKMNVGNLKALN